MNHPSRCALPVELEQRLSALTALPDDCRAALAAVAHDLNNQVMTIHGNAEILRRRHLSAEGAEIVKEILKAAEAAACIASRLNAVSRQGE